MVYQKDISAQISYEEIRALAEEAARKEWQHFLGMGQAALLDQCLNVQRAWMFFRNPAILIPTEASMKKCAIVISDRGEVRTTADFYPDLNKCHEYLQIMSNHFEERGI
jgi:glycerol dehydrogenase-like iron-containing ADH family enzyme